jgi:hypothetical protein
VPFAGGMGKIFHDLGVSMSDNIMRGEDLLSRYRTDFGPIEFDFDISKGEIDFYVYPHTAIMMCYNIGRGEKFELKETLYNLTPVFSHNKPIYGLDGQAQENMFHYYRNSGHIPQIKSHEMNHVLFYSEFRFLDDLMGKKSDVIKHIPLIHPIAPVFDYLKFGKILARWSFNMPRRINSEAYWYSPHEIEAYTMQRPSTSNLHPFYKKD